MCTPFVSVAPAYSISTPRGFGARPTGARVRQCDPRYRQRRPVVKRAPRRRRAGQLRSPEIGGRLRSRTREECAEVSQPIVVLGNLHPVEACLFAGLAEEADAARYQSVVVIRVDLLAVDRCHITIA